MSADTRPQLEVEAQAGVAIRLAQLDADLYGVVPPEQRTVADRLAVATSYRIEPGRWEDGAAMTALQRCGSAIVVRGLLVQDTALGGRTSSQLLGPGSVLACDENSVTSLSSEVRWTAGGEGAIVAVLDERFTRACELWPRLTLLLHRRLTQQLQACALHMAIVALPRAEHRVLALLWQLADRWGSVGRDGIAVHLPLTHELIGRLIGARRPTVSLAIQALVEEGALAATPMAGCSRTTRWVSSIPRGGRRHRRRTPWRRPPDANVSAARRDRSSRPSPRCARCPLRRAPRPAPGPSPDPASRPAASWPSCRA